MSESQQGFTLVELLVGMAINLFIIGVALTYFVSTTQSYKVQSVDGRIQENARITFELLTNNLRRAGLCGWSSFESCTNTITPINVTSTGNTCAAAGSTGIATTACLVDFAATIALPVPTDRLSISYAANSAAATACSGIATPSAEGSYYMNTFWAEDHDGDAVSSLQCEAFLIDTVTGLVTSLGTNQLIDGVESIQFEYGVDASADADTDVDGYLDATALRTQVAAGTITNNSIKTVRVAVLVSTGTASASDINLEDDETRKYTLLGQDIQFDKGDDRARELKQIFSTTIALKN